LNLAAILTASKMRASCWGVNVHTTEVMVGFAFIICVVETGLAIATATTGVVVRGGTVVSCCTVRIGAATPAFGTGGFP